MVVKVQHALIHQTTTILLSLSALIMIIWVSTSTRNSKRKMGIGEVLGSTCRGKSFSCGYNKEANTAVIHVLRTI